MYTSLTMNITKIKICLKINNQFYNLYENYNAQFDQQNRNQNYEM